MSKNKEFENQIDLYEQWMDGIVRLEVYNAFTNKWSTIPNYNGDITFILPLVRAKESIKVPKEIYVTIYDNGKMFAHLTEKEANLAVDDVFRDSEYVTKLFELVEY